MQETGVINWTVRLSAKLVCLPNRYVRRTPALFGHVSVGVAGFVYGLLLLLFSLRMGTHQIVAGRSRKNFNFWTSASPIFQGLFQSHGWGILYSKYTIHDERPRGGVGDPFVTYKPPDVSQQLWYIHPVPCRLKLRASPPNPPANCNHWVVQRRNHGQHDILIVSADRQIQPLVRKSTKRKSKKLCIAPKHTNNGKRHQGHGHQGDHGEAAASHALPHTATACTSASSGRGIADTDLPYFHLGSYTIGGSKGESM